MIKKLSDDGVENLRVAFLKAFSEDYIRCKTRNIWSVSYSPRNLWQVRSRFNGGINLLPSKEVALCYMNLFYANMENYLLSIMREDYFGLYLIDYTPEEFRQILDEVVEERFKRRYNKLEGTRSPSKSAGAIA